MLSLENIDIYKTIVMFYLYSVPISFCFILLAQIRLVYYVRKYNVPFHRDKGDLFWGMVLDSTRPLYNIVFIVDALTQAKISYLYFLLNFCEVNQIEDVMEYEALCDEIERMTTKELM